MKIKPHHFIDIIKLYGSGLEVFVPDEKMNHDFYRVANELIRCPQTLLTLTIEADDICQPCYQCINGVCQDMIINTNIKKDDYNKFLDQKIIEQLDLRCDCSYQADELCEIIYQHKEIIFDVWQQEEPAKRQQRFDLFVKGAMKYLKKG